MTFYSQLEMTIKSMYFELGTFRNTFELDRMSTGLATLIFEGNQNLTRLEKRAEIVKYMIENGGTVPVRILNRRAFPYEISDLLNTASNSSPRKLGLVEPAKLKINHRDENRTRVYKITDMEGARAYCENMDKIIALAKKCRAVGVSNES